MLYTIKNHHTTNQATFTAWVKRAILLLGFLGIQINMLAFSPPNILLILTDDQGWGDVAINGNPYLNTPNLDRLATEGVQFEHFYVDPVCAPTRAALLTGQYPFRSGAIGVSRGWENMSTEAGTIAEVLQRRGYATACYGKWHNGRHFIQHPLRQGFDLFFGFRSGGIGNYFDPVLEYNDLESIPTQGYVANVLTDSAIAFIEDHQNQPFFCYLPFNTPHTPLQVSDRYFDKYSAKGLNNTVSALYGMVENIDENIGRLLNALEKYQLEENTLVIFLSDNGPIGGAGNRFNGGMRGFKGSLDEGGIRVPAFFYWPKKLTSGKTIKSLAAHIDIFPTLIELSGSSPKEAADSDGISLLSLLYDENADTLQREIFTMAPVSSRSQQITQGSLRGTIRTPRYRCIKQEDGWKLYDMQQDPRQETNMYKENLKIAAQLSERVKHYLNQIPKSSLVVAPCPIGQSDAHRHVLYADEADLGEEVRYFKEFGFNSDWVTDFKTGEEITWRVSPADTRKYRVYLRYTTTTPGIKLAVGNDKNWLSATLTSAFDPDFYQVANRQESKGRSSLRKPWKDQYLGELTIVNSTKYLTVKRLDRLESVSLDIRAIILEPK